MSADLEVLRERLRGLFPPFCQPDAPSFLDNAAGTLVPQGVVEAVAGCLSARGVVNSLPGYKWGREQGAVKLAAHQATGLFVNAPNGGEDIVLGPSATALAFRLSAALGKRFTASDAIVLSALEHECNASPWRELSDTLGLELRIWKPRWPEGTLHVEDLAPLLADGRTRLVALTAASNCFGLATQCIRQAADAAHAAGALLCVDAVHGAPHALPDVVRDDMDFLLFSPYKLLAPHLGGLYIRGSLIAALDVPTLHFYDKGAASKFELGTAPYEALAGWLAALEYFAVQLGGKAPQQALAREHLLAAWEVVQALEEPVKAALVHGLRDTEGVTVYGSTALEARVGTVGFHVRGTSPAKAATYLGDKGVYVVSVGGAGGARRHTQQTPQPHARIALSAHTPHTHSQGSGHFYATIANDELGLMPHGVVRASIAHYTSLQDVERLLTHVRELVAQPLGE